MNEKRFMVRGQSADDGKMVTGYYAFIPASQFCSTDRHFVAYAPEDDPDDLVHELVDPASIEPVAVPVICKITSNGEDVGYEFAYYYCPNCLNDVSIEYRKEKEPARYKPNCCVDCGQHLDWQADTPELLKEFHGLR